VTPVRQRILARVVLFAFAGVCAVWLARLDYGRKISTDVLDLLPPEEKSPEVIVLRGLAGDLQARVLLFALQDSARPGTPPAAAARALVARLRQSPSFAEAEVLDGAELQAGFGRAVFDHRYELLLPSWLGRQERAYARTGRPPGEYSAWLADQAAGDLELFLSRPEAMPLQDLVPHDPLLLVPRLIDAVHFLDAPGGRANGYALVWAQIRPSPLTEAGQGPVFAEIAQAERALHASHPAVTVLWSGVNRFAAASRARIEAEIKVLNVLSVLAVLAVGAVFLRQIWKILYLLPVIACSLLGAWTASTLVFPRLHILVFVIGSLLSGVAVDYGFYIYLQPPARPGEPYADKLGRLLKPLLASCLTTVIGFSLLLFSDLPFIRQVGFFVSAGLLCALGSAMLYFAQFRHPFLEARQFGRISFARHHPALRRLLQIAFFAALVIAVTAPWRTRWRDDIRELDIPSPGLMANEVKLRTLFGEDADRSLYLTYGSTVAQARERLERFLEHEAKDRAATHAASLGLVFPSEEDWTKTPVRLRRLDGFAGDFRAALQRHGFDPGAFVPFFTDWDDLRLHPPRGDYASLYRELAGAIHGPLAQLYQIHGSLAYFITIVDGPGGALPPPEFSTVSLNELQSLNRLFTRYRWSALRLSLVGLGLVIGSVFLIYPFQRAVRIALIPAGSCFFVLGALALAGQTLNLFHLLGAFLGLCLAHNYAIFSADSAQTGAAPPAAIRLSAASAAVSFAVLACSHIPVVHALGLIVCLIVLTALIAVEWEPMLRGRPAPDRRP